MSRDRDDEGPVDLARERRVRALFDDLEAQLRASPDTAERLAAVLAGELDAPDLEVPVSDEEKETAVRLPEELVRRADGLIELLRDHPELRRWGRTSRASVVRLAVLRGLALLEAEVGRDVNLSIWRERDHWAWRVAGGVQVLPAVGLDKPETAIRQIYEALRERGVTGERAFALLLEAVDAMGPEPK